mgnify:CR=1 FL=1
MENQAWSFNQPVLLNKTRRNSSVLVWTLVGTTVFATGWAFLAPLPETVAVQGKLQPSSPVRDIEAPLPGVVEAVLVAEGQSVKSGETLVRFDPREVRSKLEAATVNRDGLRNQLAINQVLLGEQPIDELTTNQLALLRSSRQRDRNSRTSDAESLEGTKVRLEGHRQTLQTAITIAERYRRLYKDGAASELQMLTAQRDVDQARNDVDTVEREVAQLEATGNGNQAGREADLRQAIEDILRRIADLDEEIAQHELDLSRINVTAPINGVVFNLGVSRGSLVERNETRPLLKLIPQNQLQAKVYIPNDAIGFIKPEQGADISLTSFNASDYGHLPATVKQVGSDALTPDEQGRVLGTSAEGLHFPAVLTLSRQTLQVGDRSIPLQAGMSLTADIHLRNRRFISAITDVLESSRSSLERLR